MDNETVKNLALKSELLKTDKAFRESLENQSNERIKDSKKFLERVNIAFENSIPDHIKKLTLNSLNSDIIDFTAYSKVMFMTSCHADEELFNMMAQQMQNLIDKIKDIGEKTLELNKLRVQQEH